MATNPALSIAIALVAVTAGGPALSAQDRTEIIARGSQRVLGGGCRGLPAPTVTGPLTVGSILSIDDVGCSFIGSPGSFHAVAFGIPLPEALWIPIHFPNFTPITCQLAILPLSVRIGREEPFRVQIPNNPALRGLEVGMQTYCWICGFRGCDSMLSQALEITIG